MICIKGLTARRAVSRLDPDFTKNTAVAILLRRLHKHLLPCHYGR